MVVRLDLVGTLLVIIIARNYAQVDMTHSLAEGQRKIGKAAKSVWRSKGKDVSGPEEMRALDIESLARGKEADGDLRITLGLLGCKSLGGALSKRVDDRVFGDKGVLDNSQEDLHWQIWKPVRGVIQGGETGTAAAGCQRMGLVVDIDIVGSGLKCSVRGDLRVPGDARFAKQPLEVHIFTLEELVSSTQRGIVAELGLLLMVTAVPWESCRCCHYDCGVLVQLPRRGAMRCDTPS